MTKYNPEWRRQGNVHTLISDGLIGIVRVPECEWEVNPIERGTVMSGKTDDLIAAKAAVEKIMGYKFFLEEDYKTEPGCKCGSCSMFTGKWRVTSRDDIVDMLFDSEAAALEWINKSKNC